MDSRKIKNMLHTKNFSINFLIFVFICMKYEFEPVCGEIRCIEREREALLEFKQQLTDKHGSLLSWGSEDHQKGCCSWKGVTCSNTSAHVTRLILNEGFGGKISPTLLELQHLNYLDLGGNDFGGDRIPDFMGSIKALEYLYLGDSNFSGVIPPQLGNLTYLHTLDLRFNHLMSDNLDWLSHLSLLSELYLTGANISDPNWVQHAVVNLPSLQSLILTSCKLKHVTTSHLVYNSSSLSSLVLSYNKLTSSTFDWLFNVSTHLVEINLMFNELDGSLPDAFGKLNSLMYLNLQYNKLEGGIPKSLGNLSRLQGLGLSYNDMGGSLENLSCQRAVSLHDLMLSNNRLTGPLPDLGACSELQTLDLGSNRLTGPLPVSYGQLPNLGVLDVSYNDLQGTVSEANFKELRNLRTLGLSYNSLTLDLRTDWVPPFNLTWLELASCKMSSSSFPRWLHSQTNIYYLDISLAGISDEVPTWLWSMSNLKYLNMSYNHMSGAVLDLSPSITMLDVSSNNLSGPLPPLFPDTRLFQLSSNMFSGSIPSMCPHHDYCRLSWLDVSNNQLEGALPSRWENMFQLEILNVNYNKLSGEIPHDIGSLPRLTTLHLRGNDFVGELPPTLKNCQLLQMIDVGQNRLTGDMVPWLTENLTGLAFLSLRQNMFFGDITSEICKLTQIQLLDLAENNFTGTIPKCFNNFSALVDKNTTAYTTNYDGHIVTPHGSYNDYALVQWKGREAEYNRTLRLLKLIDISSNKLVGSIPESFSKLKGLISLNLSRNSLTGNIIPGIGEMESLETLDLSRNQLSGKIFISLVQLNYLGVLDLSNNNLSGEIPKSTQLQSFNASVYAGNNGLCGDPLPLCPNTTITDEEDDMDKKDDGFFMQSSTLEFCITLILGFIVGFWGVVGSLVLKRSWRVAYFKFLNAVGNWLRVTTAVVLTKFRRSFN